MTHRSLSIEMKHPELGPIMVDYVYHSNPRQYDIEIRSITAQVESDDLGYREVAIDPSKLKESDLKTIEEACYRNSDTWDEY